MQDPLRILIVDDNPGDRALVKAHLSGSATGRYETDEADSAIGGLERLERGDIDCVLLDVRMPAMSGWEAYREVERRYNDVAVVMMTGIAEQAAQPPRSFLTSPDLLHKGSLTTEVLAGAIQHSIALKSRDSGA